MAQENKNNEEVELSGAMKNSGTGVKFEDSGQRAVSHDRGPTPKIIRWTMKYSGDLIKNEQQAQWALVGVAVIAFAMSIYLFFGGNSSKSTPTRIIDFPELQRQNAR